MSWYSWRANTFVSFVHLISQSSPISIFGGQCTIRCLFWLSASSHRNAFSSRLNGCVGHSFLLITQSALSPTAPRSSKPSFLLCQVFRIPDHPVPLFMAITIGGGTGLSNPQASNGQIRFGLCSSTNLIVMNRKGGVDGLGRTVITPEQGRALQIMTPSPCKMERTN